MQCRLRTDRKHTWALREGLPVSHANPLPPLEEGLEEARRRLGPGASVAVMPEGPHVIPTAADEEHRPDRLEGGDAP